MQSNIDASLRAVTKVRNLADTYRYTATPVDSGEMAAMLKWSADEFEKALLHHG